MLSTSSGVFDDASRFGDVSDLFGKQMQVYGAYTIACLVLTAGLTGILLRQPTTTTAASAAPLRRAG
jgi:hypothetical protein